MKFFPQLHTGGKTGVNRKGTLCPKRKYQNTARVWLGRVAFYSLFHFESEILQQKLKSNLQITKLM